MKKIINVNKNINFFFDPSCLQKEKEKMESKRKPFYRVYKNGGRYYVYTSTWQHLLRKIGFRVGEPINIHKYVMDAKTFPLVDNSICIQAELNGGDEEEQW